MRWGFAALAAMSMVTWTDPIRPASVQRSGVRGQIEGLAAGLTVPAPSGAGPFSLFEDFPFSLSAGDGGPGLDAPAHAIALDPDPDRFGSGMVRSLEDPDPSGDFVPAGKETGWSVAFGETLLDTVLSDPLLRDLFGPGPLTQFLEHMLSALRGEGGHAHHSGEAQAAHSAPLRRRDQSRSGGGSAGGAFVGGLAQGGAILAPAAGAFLAAPTDQSPDGGSAGQGQAEVARPPANTEAGARPEPELPPGASDPRPTPPQSPVTIPSPAPVPVVVPDPLPPPRPDPAPAVSAVAEPATVATFLVGLLGLLALGRPRRAVQRARG